MPHRIERLVQGPCRSGAAGGSAHPRLTIVRRYLSLRSAPKRSKIQHVHTKRKSHVLKFRVWNSSLSVILAVRRRSRPAAHRTVCAVCVLCWWMRAMASQVEQRCEDGAIEKVQSMRDAAWVEDCGLASLSMARRTRVECRRCVVQGTIEGDEPLSGQVDSGPRCGIAAEGIGGAGESDTGRRGRRYEQIG